ncbi:hypothetical protein SCMC78_29530 [Streptomyces sp. CMC78]|uniref:Single-stranded DNA-binding protein n=1 Tax=Streptomyces sp. CMC78 TaxID=3231512 RepID=A0AB33KER4_9ACTN
MYLPKGAEDVDDKELPLQVKRATRVTVNAAPEPARKGGTITVTGRVTRANWNTHTYQGYGGRTVSLQFKAAGSSAYKTVKKVKGEQHRRAQDHGEGRHVRDLALDVLRQHHLRREVVDRGPGGGAVGPVRRAYAARMRPTCRSRRGRGVHGEARGRAGRA